MYTPSDQQPLAGRDDHAAPGPRARRADHAGVLAAAARRAATATGVGAPIPASHAARPPAELAEQPGQRLARVGESLEEHGRRGDDAPTDPAVKSLLDALATASPRRSCIEAIEIEPERLSQRSTGAGPRCAPGRRGSRRASPRSGPGARRPRWRRRQPRRADAPNGPGSAERRSRQRCQLATAPRSRTCSAAQYGALEVARTRSAAAHRRRRVCGPASPGPGSGPSARSLIAVARRPRRSFGDSGWRQTACRPSKIRFAPGSSPGESAW